MIFANCCDSRSWGVASRLCPSSFPAGLPPCSRLAIPLPPEPGRRGCSRAPSLRGPHSEWEAPAAGCEAGANPRGKGAKGPGCPLAGLLHLSTPEEREGDPRGGDADRDSAARAPAPGLPTSGCSSLGGAVPVANLRDSAPSRGSAVSKTLPYTQAGPPGSVLSDPARLSSQKPPEPGTLRSPTLTAPAEPGAVFSFIAPRLSANPWGRAAPLAGPGEERALA